MLTFLGVENNATSQISSVKLPHGFHFSAYMHDKHKTHKRIRSPRTPARQVPELPRSQVKKLLLQLHPHSRHLARHATLKDPMPFPSKRWPIWGCTSDLTSTKSKLAWRPETSCSEQTSGSPIVHISVRCFQLNSLTPTGLILDLFLIWLFLCSLGGVI